MSQGKEKMPGKRGAGLLLFFFDFTDRLLLALFFAFLLFFLFGDHVELDGMDLYDFHLHVTFRTAQDFAFFDFVFVEVNVGIAFRAFHQGPPSGTELGQGAYYIPPLSSISSAGGVEVQGEQQKGMSRREYPQQPVVGVGGVVIQDGRALLIRRGSEPLAGQWSIPGGTLELGETIAEGVRRELREETGLEVHVLELIEVFDRIFRDSGGRTQYHFVILDYLCETVAGTPRPGSDVTDVAFVGQEELNRYSLTEAVTRVLGKAFAMARTRAAEKAPGS